MYKLSKITRNIEIYICATTPNYHFLCRSQSSVLQLGFPLGLENLEKWEGIFQSGKSQGILNRLEKSGKSQGKSHKILENSGNLRYILFDIFSDI